MRHRAWAHSRKQAQVSETIYVLSDRQEARIPLITSLPDGGSSEIARLRWISRDDLAFLAPYIDDWIAGKAPPQGLPPEYYDWRPDTLGSPD